MRSSKRLSSFDRRRQRVRHALRAKSGGRLRLSVSRSGKHIYAQVIDDGKGVTLAHASTLDKDLKKKLKSTSTVEAAKQVGTLVAERAKAANVREVVFDRGGHLFHGRIKALADAARDAGLSF